MNARMGRKIIAWAVGMALVGAILRAKASYAHRWYGVLVDDPAMILGGAGTGLFLGFLFSLRLRNSK